MVDLKSERKGEGKYAKTNLSWEHQGQTVSLSFSSVARHITVEDKNLLFVSVYSDNTIYKYGLDGQLLALYQIPEKKGYQYRGINRNLKSRPGVSLLYAPIEEGCGNQWGDIEQYELATESDPLGKYLDIYR